MKSFLVVSAAWLPAWLCTNQNDISYGKHLEGGSARVVCMVGSSRSVEVCFCVFCVVHTNWRLPKSSVIYEIKMPVVLKYISKNLVLYHFPLSYTIKKDFNKRKYAYLDKASFDIQYTFSMEILNQSKFLGRSPLTSTCRHSMPPWSRRGQTPGR